MRWKLWRRVPREPAPPQPAPPTERQEREVKAAVREMRSALHDARETIIAGERLTQEQALLDFWGRYDGR